MENNLFFVSYEKEASDTVKLIENVKGWVDQSTIIVNCFPDYSSIVCQLINHKLSFRNKNSLYEQIGLEIPYKGMKQIWNRDKIEYEFFDKYIIEWSKHNISPDCKYLFVFQRITNDVPLTKIKSCIRGAEYKFTCLYNQSEFVIDHTIENVPSERRILSGWENSNNNNF